MSILGDFLIQVGRHLNDHQRAQAKRVRVRKMIAEVRGGRPGKSPRKPPEAGIAASAIPPRGPVPLQGGAEASLDSSD